MNDENSSKLKMTGATVGPPKEEVRIEKLEKEISTLNDIIVHQGRVIRDILIILDVLRHAINNETIEHIEDIVNFFGAEDYDRAINHP
jgi:hypothetical protein